MGWEQGKGLGAKEDGMTEHVKVKFKGDNKGVGYNKNDYDNVWLEHQDDYEELLNNLKKTSSSQDLQKLKDSPAQAETQVQSLELNSKNSKARLHYRKFTKSKDLSNASLHDLNCILGREKRQKLAASEPKNMSENSSDSSDVRASFKRKSDDEDENKKSEDKEVANGIQFNTNKLSMSDYFKSKMAAKLNSNKSEEISKEEEAEVVEEVEEEPKKKKKKSKKEKSKEKTDAEPEEIVEEVVAEVKETVSVTNDAKSSFAGSNLFDIYGYSSYYINADLKEVLKYKVQKNQKKQAMADKNLKNDPKFYEMSKKKSI